MQLCTVRESEVSNARQLTITANAYIRKTNVVIKCLFANLCDGIGKIDMYEVIASLKSRTADALELFGQDDLAQTSLTLKRFLTNTGDNLTVNHIGNGDIATTTRVRTNFNRAVIQLNVCKRNTVLFVYPLCVKGEVGGKFIGVPVIFLSTIGIIIPAVKDCIESFGLGHILQCMVADEELLGVLEFIGHHVKGDCSALFHNESIDIQRAITVIVVTAKIAKIVARSVQNLFYREELLITIDGKIKRNGTRNNGRCQGCTILRTICSPHQCGIGGTGSNEIDVLTIVGVGCQAPTVCFECANAKYVGVCCRVRQGCSTLVTGSGNANNITIKCQLCCLGKGICK